MKTIDAYKEKQQHTISILQNLLDYLNEGKKYGIKVNSKTIEKIQNAINKTEENKLKISLIGGFSEGKTSIAAAWSEQYDESTMKISQAESTDEIKIYNCNDDYILIDTPGLYGFKETADKEKYKDITKNYISESDIILYIMPSDNPIKQSHKEDLIWLFKELALISRTVFVLSRFDEEADIEDEDNYQDVLKIKKHNIIERLVDFGIIEVGYTPSIVAVSANPYGDGIDYWLNNLEEYKKISHIKELQNATFNKIKEDGGKNKLILSSQQSIVKDILIKSLPIAETKINNTIEEIKKLQKMYLNSKNDLMKFEKNISRIKINLRKYIADYFTDLILQADGTTLETINEFFEKNIGEEGIIIETNIQNEFSKQIGVIKGEINVFRFKIHTDIQHYNNIVGKMAFDGLKIGSTCLKNGSVKINNQQILAFRDHFKINYKIKPWGAIKLADKVTKGFTYLGAFIGIGIEVWDSYSTTKKKQTFQEVKKEVHQNLEVQRKAYLDLINDSNLFIKYFFPEYSSLVEQITELEKEVQNKETFKSSFEQWKHRAEVIDAEFTEIIK